MKRVLITIVLLLCAASVAFAAPKKKKKAPPVEKEPEIVFDESCYGKAIDYTKLMTTNPYDTVGKCYWIGFPLVKQQLLSRSFALVGFASAQQNVFALMNFGDESVPMGPITGLVMGAGAYEYETVSGSVNTVHKLVRMKEYLKETKEPKPAQNKSDATTVDNKDLEKYYPLAEGRSSTYCMFDDCSLKEVDTITNCNGSEGGNKGCIKQSILSSKNDTDGMKTRAKYEIIGKKLVITAGTNPLTGEYRAFDDPSLVIQSPLIKGATWEEINDKFKTIVKIVNVLPSYKVTAGEYTDVIKIEKKQYTNDKKPSKTKKPINIFYEYYAANVGLIKQEMLKDKKTSRVRELIEFSSKE